MNNNYWINVILLYSVMGIRLFQENGFYALQPSFYKAKMSKLIDIDNYLSAHDIWSFI